MKTVQILYPTNDNSSIKQCFLEESEEMRRKGFIVDIKPLEESDIIIFRSNIIKSEVFYPTETRMVQGWKQYSKTLFMSEYIDIIAEFTIPTVILYNLEENDIINIMYNRKWEKVFIKSDSSSLFAYGNEASIYPSTSIEWMKQKYNLLHIHGPFAIRQFIDDPQIFYDEQRYWVLNGNPYHPSGVIPAFVAEAAKRMYEFSGSHYFTIDVAGNYIVEVNPGESSDRGGDNPLDFFCEIFAKEFLNKQ